MIFKPFASSSSGNCYLVTAPGSRPLLLDAGIPIKHIRKHLYANGHLLTHLEGCLIDHEHGDHSKAVKDLLKAGVDCYMSAGTARKIPGIISDHHRINIVLALKPFPIGKWNILPFPLQHDAAEPLGFIIGHGSEKLLFIPDTAYVKDRFNGITLIAAECNNITELLLANVERGSIPAFVAKRIRRNHMNLNSFSNMLKANDLSKCREIYLMHLSDGNSDAEAMKRRVQEITGIETRIC